MEGGSMLKVSELNKSVTERAFQRRECGEGLVKVQR